MDKNKDLYLVFFDEGHYTQHRFLCETEEDARNQADRLNKLFGYEMNEDGEREDGDTEYWKYEQIDFKPSYE